MVFAYDGYCAVLESGVDEQLRFDAHIEVYGITKSVRVQYDSPYIRHLPTTLVINETVGDAYQQRVERPTFKDPYTHEIEYFHDVVTTGVSPKTSPEDFMDDLRLMRLIVDALRAEPTAELQHERRVTSPIPIVIDTDVGADPDDALALILALASPEVDVRGVTIVSGDVSWRARIATRLLGMAGRSDVPVFLGRGEPQQMSGAEGEGCSTVRTTVPRRQFRPPPPSTGSSPNRAAAPFISSPSGR